MQSNLSKYLINEIIIRLEPTNFNINNFNIDRKRK